MTRVLLVDDHASFRQPLAMLLERESDMQVIAQAGTLAEARAASTDCEVAVVDLSLPDGSGVDLIGELHASESPLVVVVLTATEDPQELARAVEAGAVGVVHKSAGVDAVLQAIRSARDGEPLLTSSEIVEMLRLAGRTRERDQEAQRALTQLTRRELEVLQSLADGLSDKQIAERLHIHPQTARTHMVNILGKLGVESRLQALVFAVRHGAVSIN
jgi:DNA-binding NarL/FixJ family response regulator